MKSLISKNISEVRSKSVELKAEAMDFTSTALMGTVQNRKKPVTVGAVFKEELADLRDAGMDGLPGSMEQVYNSLIKFNKHLDQKDGSGRRNWLRTPLG